jgi:ATP-dependent DNA helicase PIF1
MLSWSPSQKKALDLAGARKSFLLTGPAGTGKSAVIEEIKNSLSKRNLQVMVTATTGIAAMNVGGKTLHSFMRLNPNDLSTMTKEQLAEKCSKNRYFSQDLKKYHTLIIDEVSMLDPDLFETVDWILRVLRRCPKPFGGLQVILVGDLFQLPPVRRASDIPALNQSVLCLPSSSLEDAENDRAKKPEHLGVKKVVFRKFLFESPIFFELMDDVVELTEIWRQKDKDFVSLLLRMRKGELTEGDKDSLRDRLDADLDTSDGIKPTILFSRNVDIDRINSEELGRICEPSVKFGIHSGHFLETAPARPGPAGSTGRPPKEMAESMLGGMKDKMLKDMNIPQTLELKVGAQVMLIRNLDVESGLVNGSRGVVVRFTRPSPPEEKEAEHDECEDVSDEEFSGKKRKRSDKEDRRPPTKKGSLTKSKEAKGFHSQHHEEPILYPEDLPMPVVAFKETSGKIRLVEIPYYRWSKSERGIGEAYVWQVPLRLAWACTIHKSQGMSLDKVEICLDRHVFEEGQAYVAVSRVRSLQGLRVTALAVETIRVNSHVKKFYSLPFGVLKGMPMEGRREALGLE